nr:hypothetical protein RVX_2216 [Nitratidesulfovibrio sp. HK-II]
MSRAVLRVVAGQAGPVEPVGPVRPESAVGAEDGVRAARCGWR